MRTDSKGEPITAVQELVDRRHVRVAVGNCVRMGNGTGGLFLPDTLQLAWRNGQVMNVLLSGRELRTDGYQWVDGRRSTRQYVTGAGQMDPETPDWVLQLISAHAPGTN